MISSAVTHLLLTTFFYYFINFAYLFLALDLTLATVIAYRNEKVFDWYSLFFTCTAFLIAFKALSGIPCFLVYIMRHYCRAFFKQLRRTIFATLS